MQYFLHLNVSKYCLKYMFHVVHGPVILHPSTPLAQMLDSSRVTVPRRSPNDESSAYLQLRPSNAKSHDTPCISTYANIPARKSQ